MGILFVVFHGCHGSHRICCCWFGFWKFSPQSDNFHYWCLITVHIYLFQEFFENPAFRADGLKIYPTLVIRGTGTNLLILLFLWLYYDKYFRWITQFHKSQPCVCKCKYNYHLFRLSIKYRNCCHIN